MISKKTAEQNDFRRRIMVRLFEFGYETPQIGSAFGITRGRVRYYLDLSPTAPVRRKKLKLGADVWKRIFEFSMPEPNSGCWLWLANCSPRGYGKLTVEGKSYRAHRVVFFLVHGMWPPLVRHKCDNPYCVNPDHLEAGTNLDNSKDCLSRGRQARGEKQGASILTEDNARFIKTSLRDKTHGVMKLSRMFGVQHTTVSRIGLGKSWTWVVV